MRVERRDSGGGLVTHGKIALVGAGPGDPELLTVKALRCLERADVIVYDRLVSNEILELAPAGAALISVGKSPANHPVPQNEINQMLVRLAQSNRRVVRLKGGDPFIFGRGSEEAMELARHGVQVEVVPGITAAQGCAAAFKIPLTHRGLASGVRYLTGHCRHDLDLEFDWQGLADPDTTLVVYMGQANITEIADRLMANGLSGEIPVLVVCNGTTEREQHLVTKLCCVSREIEIARFEGPVLFIVGNVASLAKSMEPCDAAVQDIAVSALA